MPETRTLLPPHEPIHADQISEPDPRPSGQPRRADIQGLRGAAVLMVLLYHAGIPFIPGGFAGVDVFFVISGFVITSLMLRELENTGRLSLLHFWARRAKRLLPATAIVLVAVAALSIFALPRVRWIVTAGDIVASASYVVNWRLGSQSLDYLAQDYPASPVQHFWSLAVEEQFYLIWPLLVVAIAALGRRFGWPLRRSLMVGVALLVIPSLIWSIYRSSGHPEAYFVTTTRAWELGIGAIIALAAGRLERLNRLVGAALTWIGFVTLIGVALLLPDSLAWPGSTALIPTVATALVIAAGPAAGTAGATQLLGRSPIRWLGDLSYSLYLWHWPFIVFALARWDHLTAAEGLLVISLSFVPAYCAYRWVEAPLHHSRTLTKFPVRALSLAAVCTMIGVSAGVGLQVALPETKSVPASARPGARALMTDPKMTAQAAHGSSITPDPLQATEDLPDLYGRGCQGDYKKATPKPCVFGSPSAKVTVALVGDSRAAQWSPALQEVAQQEHWRLITITKSGCPLADVELVKGSTGHERGYPSCTKWYAAVMTLLTSGPDRPDFVVTTSFAPFIATVDGKVLTGQENERALIDGYHRSWKALNKEGIPVVALRETPRMGRDIAECVSQHRDRLDECTVPRERAMQASHFMERAARGLRASATIDLTSAICPQECPAVIGGVLIYRDTHHLTATYARTLAPFLSNALAGLRAEGFDHGSLNGVLPHGQR